MGDHESRCGNVYGRRMTVYGRIIKGIGGFYYIHTADGIYTCRAKGVFRHDGTKPLVGDYVDIDIVDAREMTGNVSFVRERSNELIRPNVANVDQALVIFSMTRPEPNFVTLDKMILQYRSQDIRVLICFNKEDLSDKDPVEELLADYAHSGCALFVTSAVTGEGIDALSEALSDKTTTVAGPSGVGKSSIINRLTNQDTQKTGNISDKLARGKHTTRHSEIIPLGDNTFIIDTPGFGSFDLFDVRPEDLSDYYEEFKDIPACRFMPCSHTHEPDCSVKAAVEGGLISRRRYDNYVHIYNESLRSRRY